MNTKPSLTRLFHLYDCCYLYSLVLNGSSFNMTLPDELLEVYSPLLNIIAFEQGEVSQPKPAVWLNKADLFTRPTLRLKPPKRTCYHAPYLKAHLFSYFDRCESASRIRRY